MKKTVIYIAGIILLTLSCNPLQYEQPVQYGRLSVTLGDPDVEVVTKASNTLSPDDPEAANYTVSIYAEDGALKYSSRYDTLKSKDLAFGRYYVIAQNCTESEAETGNGMMHVYGQSEPVEISLENLFATATVDCAVKNAMVTVSFDASLYDEAGECHLDGLKAVLTTAAGRERSVAETDGETVIWFNTDDSNPTAVTYAITGSFNGRPVSAGGTITVRPKDSVKLAIQVKLEKGEIAVPGASVSFNTSIGSEEPETGGFNPYV